MFFNPVLICWLGTALSVARPLGAVTRRRDGRRRRRRRRRQSGPSRYRFEDCIWCARGGMGCGRGRPSHRGGAVVTACRRGEKSVWGRYNNILLHCRRLRACADCGGGGGPAQINVPATNRPWLRRAPPTNVRRGVYVVAEFLFRTTPRRGSART